MGQNMKSIAAPCFKVGSISLKTFPLKSRLTLLNDASAECRAAQEGQRKQPLFFVPMHIILLAINQTSEISTPKIISESHFSGHDVKFISILTLIGAILNLIVPYCYLFEHEV